MRVERVYRKLLDGFGRTPSASIVELSEPSSNLECNCFVMMAVCVTLSGIIVFLTGASKTICAASARFQEVVQSMTSSPIRDSYDRT